MKRFFAVMVAAAALMIGSSAAFAQMMKDESKARSAFAALRTEQEKIVQAQPDYGPALCVLGLIDAALGRKEAALEEGRRAIELLPVEKDSVNGSRMLVYFAIMWFGAFYTGMRMGLPYDRNASIAFTAAGNNFELAIAVAIAIGVGLAISAGGVTVGATATTRTLIHKHVAVKSLRRVDMVSELITIWTRRCVALEAQQLFPSCSVFSGIEQGSAKSCCVTRL